MLGRDFADREGGGMELAVINPVGILGPPLGPDLSVNVEVVEQLLDGKLPALPRLNWGVVDVRDVADLHVPPDRGDDAGHHGRPERPGPAPGLTRQKPLAANQFRATSATSFQPLSRVSE